MSEYQNRDIDTMSRTTTRSKRSTMSRSQTLIKKNIAPHDLRPSDIIIERFQAWKSIVKQLIAYFEGIADIENNTARELTKLGGVIQVPFRSGNQFLGEGGLQDVFYNMRDKTRIIADHHANLGRTIDGSIVQHLRKLLSEIKGHVRNVEKDTGRLATSVAKEREASTKEISELQRCIALFKNTPMAVTAKDDPYVQNILVSKQLQKQVLEENALQKSIIVMQQSSAHFEEGIVRSIQSTWQTFDEWQTRMSDSVQETWRALSISMASLAPDREWIEFAARTDHLLDPETPLRNPDTIEYPSKDDTAIFPVHIGHMERKKRWTRTYHESYFVLTPAGWLHEYTSSDPAIRTTPVFSVFLPLCTLGPPSSATHSGSHKFHIEGKANAKANGGRSNSIKASILGRGSAQSWTFRCRSHEDMMEWWNDVRMLCARYLIASEQVERSGPVEAAVRSAGYISEDDYGTEEGSSIEEEEEQQQARAVGTGEGQPMKRYELHDAEVPYGYQSTSAEHEKKRGPNHPGSWDIPDTNRSEAGGDVSRRPSKRQLEKAPEGKAPKLPPLDVGARSGSPGGAGPVVSDAPGVDRSS